MRRSVRDAIVGFTVIGGIVGFASTALWLRGLRLGAGHWSLTARFNDAAGLAERSPVTYRGILVGSVRSIEVTPEAVVAELEINQADLHRREPPYAHGTRINNTLRYFSSFIDPDASKFEG